MQAPGYFRYDMFSQGIFVDPMAPVQRLQYMAERIVPLTSSFPLIRLGANTDDGYLVLDYLSNIKSCCSPGVDTFATFEAYLFNGKIN